MKMKKNKVFVTSCSVISSLGIGNEESLNNLSSGISPIHFPETDERFKYPYFLIKGLPDPGEGLIKNSQIALKLISLIEKTVINHDSIPLFFSTSTGGISETEKIYDKFQNKEFKYPLFERHFFNKTVNDIKSVYPSIFSESFTFSTACSSSGHGILQAYEFIKIGRAHV
jgi:3-oxoacyl-(acyl-carrier-protein) synthase